MHRDSAVRKQVQNTFSEMSTILNACGIIKVATTIEKSWRKTSMDLKYGPHG
jgi:hypothetical protein